MMTLDQLGDNNCGKYSPRLVVTMMMMMMELRSVEKEPISMTMNQGRSGGSKYLPTVADNDTHVVKNCQVDKIDDNILMAILALY